jgi:hypothetical protein
MPNKNTRRREPKLSESGDERLYPKSNRLYKVGMCFCLCASLLVIGEGVILAFISPLFYGAQLLQPWDGYMDLLLGIVMLIGLIFTAKLSRKTIGWTASATAIGLCSIASLVLFGGGFYVGFILGLTGTLLTATRE